MDSQAAPSAQKVVCVDLDATIIPWGPLEEIRPPFSGVVRAMTNLREAGFRIVILTSRLSKTWHEHEAVARGIDATAFGYKQLQLTLAILDAAGIPYDDVTSEKVPAVAYFDDKAIRVTESFPLPVAIMQFLWESEQ